MPDIVYIDDERDDISPLAGDSKERIQYFPFDTDNIDPKAFEAAKKAEVWLFDFFLATKGDAEGDDENGLSLFQKWKAMQSGRPTTVVVSSDFEKAIGEPLGPLARRHIVAQKHGVEWVGEKSGNEVAQLVRQIIDLADAAILIGKALAPSAGAGEAFGTYDPKRLCFEVLGAPKDAEWANSAERQIDRARPPREVSTLSKPSGARSIIGWLLSHVLPYPSFLLSDAQAALRLEMTPASFRSLAHAMDGNVKERYAATFNACRYTGPLATFHGPRWWRAAIDDFAWHLSQETGGLPPRFRDCGRCNGYRVASTVRTSSPI